ncbi:hypothetical protein FACS189472_07700 [Alphaproteobacteria bacterium]|nr:hypothetical protein FACS189472_07700 [Alphaproteobacteria bacterium]
MENAAEKDQYYVEDQKAYVHLIELLEQSSENGMSKKHMDKILATCEYELFGDRGFFGDHGSLEPERFMQCIRAYQDLSQIVKGWPNCVRGHFGWREQRLLEELRLLKTCAFGSGGYKGQGCNLLSYAYAEFFTSFFSLYSDFLDKRIAESIEKKSFSPAIAMALYAKLFDSKSFQYAVPDVEVLSGNNFSGRILLIVPPGCCRRRYVHTFYVNKNGGIEEICIGESDRHKMINGNKFSADLWGKYYYKWDTTKTVMGNSFAIDCCDKYYYKWDPNKWTITFWYQDDEKVFKFIPGKKQWILHESRKVPFRSKCENRVEAVNLEEVPQEQNAIVSSDTTPLHEACYEGKIDVVKSLIAQKVNLDAQKSCYHTTPLGYAVLKNHYDIVELLLKNGASPHGLLSTDTVYVRSALAEAIFQNNHKMIALLKKHGADINHKDEDGNTDMHRIGHMNSNDIEKLLKSGADVNAKNSNGLTALSNYYFPHGSADPEIEILKKYGANINEFHDGTALTSSTYEQDVGKAETLLKNGANPEIAGKGDVTPLHMAAKYGRSEMVQLLIKYGASVEASDSWGVTPLLSAASCGKYHPVQYNRGDEYLEIAKLLIDHGAKVNVTEKYGNTPLLCAVRANCKRMVELLLKNGAKVDVVNSYQETPLSLAKKQKNKEIQKILENALTKES